jgi:O-succinylbenzoic acid--CoA ligase
MSLHLKTLSGTTISINTFDDVDRNAELLNEIDVFIAPFLKEWLSESSEISVATSGSTGTPKKILLQKEAMVQSARQTVSFFNLHPNQKALLCLPAQYIAGKMMLVRAMVSDIELVCVTPTGNPLLSLNETIDFAACTPFQISQILQENPEKLNLIHTLIIGGGVMDDHLVKKLNENWVKTNCYSTFGMTETITHIALRKINGMDKEAFFRTLPNVTVFKTDHQTLAIFVPYIQKDPILTNDLIELLDEHRFIWKGRIDFVINSGGVKLFPEQMEEKIRSLMGTVNYYFSKESHPTLGEIPVLYIESKPFEIPNLNMLLSKYELPTKIYFEDSFSRTETGKVLRK